MKVVISLHFNNYTGWSHFKVIYSLWVESLTPKSSQPYPSNLPLIRDVKRENDIVNAMLIHQHLYEPVRKLN